MFDSVTILFFETYLQQYYLNYTLIFQYFETGLSLKFHSSQSCLRPVLEFLPRISTEWTSAYFVMSDK